jgi:hypothetical protein
MYIPNPETYRIKSYQQSILGTSRNTVWCEAYHSSVRRMPTSFPMLCSSLSVILRMHRAS